VELLVGPLGLAAAAHGFAGKFPGAHLTRLGMDYGVVDALPDGPHHQGSQGHVADHSARWPGRQRQRSDYG